MSLPDFSHSALERFLRYVQIDTQSDPESSTIPSTEKQKDLSRLLAEELLALGVSDAQLDEFGYVYGTLPATVAHEVPVICFCSHVDTSPDCSGANVKPLVHRNYDGRELVLPDDPKQVIRLSEHPDLAAQMGNDIVSASGTTLLGADNKAGVAAIMDAVQYLMAHPDFPRGAVKILFTPDEEIGRGANKVDLKKLGARFAYTIDGETLGSIEDETFSADGGMITIDGVSAHPGFAKDKLVNALKIAGEILAALPTDRLSPETTEGREGFIHPVTVTGNAEQAKIKVIFRDFSLEGLKTLAQTMQQIIEGVMQRHPKAKAELVVTEQYRNMKEVLDQHPEVVANAEEAIRRAGLKVIKRTIRGGTDGSRFSYMGLPCPNIFAGEHAFHSKLEWVSVQDMEKAAETIVQLCGVWAGK